MYTFDVPAGVVTVIFSVFVGVFLRTATLTCVAVTVAGVGMYVPSAVGVGVPAEMFTVVAPRRSVPVIVRVPRYLRPPSRVTQM